MKKSKLKLIFIVIFSCYINFGCSGKLAVKIPDYNAIGNKKVVHKVLLVEKKTSYKVPVSLAVIPAVIGGNFGVVGGALGGAVGGTISALEDMKEYEVPAIGDTYLHIKNYLENSGCTVLSEDTKTMPSDIDSVVDYYDFWQWDFKYYLKLLKITFKDPKTGEIIAEGIYEAGKGGIHDYPTSKREVPNILRPILGKLTEHNFSNKANAADR